MCICLQSEFCVTKKGFSDTCGNLIYSLLSFTRTVSSVLGSYYLTANDSAQFDNENLHQFHDILTQIVDLCVLIGNWKHLAAPVLDYKCSLREVILFKSSVLKSP